MRILRKLLREERGEQSSTYAILLAMGAAISVAVIAKWGPALYAFFTHIGNCLNGC